MNNLVNYFCILLTPAILIFIYGAYRCNNGKFKDPLELKLFNEIDLWSVTHVLFYMLLGYLHPDKFYLSMFIGVLWELFEHFYGKDRPGWLGGYANCTKTNKQNSGNWMYGKCTDIISNALGFVIGKYLKEKKNFKI